MTHYAWGPNRDAGSISMHRNPNTRRRHGCTNIPKVKAHKGRAGWRAFIHANMDDLKTGLFDVSLAGIRRGWDAGDPLCNGDPLLVLADASEAEEPYPEIPDWVWDQMYADTLDICGPLCDKRCSYH